MNTNDIPDCPFCGGESKYKLFLFYGGRGIAVRCSKCLATSRVIKINCPKVTVNGVDESTRYTEQQAKEIARNLWSCRVEKQGGKDEQES